MGIFTILKPGRSFFAILLFLLTAAGAANAQVAVTVDFPTRTTPNLAASYTSLANAITALNTVTAISGGPVTLTCAAAGAENAPVGGFSISYTAATTSANYFVLNGNGSTITAATQTAGANNDAIFKIIGSDYLTLQNFTMLEKSTNTTSTLASNNMTEFGVALFYASTTNGAKNNTIKDCTIDLTRTYTNTFGIYSNSTSTATALTTTSSPTAATGNNSGLSIIGNTITDVNVGILVLGPTAAAAHNDGLIIGGSVANANTISNYGTGAQATSYANVTGTINGIVIRNTKNFDVSNNNITSSAGAVTVSTLRGIFVTSFSNAPTGTITNKINNNTLSVRTGNTSGAVEGILLESTTGNATTTLEVKSNNFTTFGHTVASSGAVNFIKNQTAVLSHDISDNTFTALALTNTGAVTFIDDAQSIPNGGSMTISDNRIVTSFSKTSSSGNVTFFSSNASSVTGSTLTINNNNFSNITLSGTLIFTGIDNTDGASGTSAPVKTIANNTFSSISGSSGGHNFITVNYGGVGSVVSSNTITNNSTTGTPVYLALGANLQGVTASSNTITGNTSSAFTGIACATPTATISLNTVANNTATGTTGSKGITVTNPTTVTLDQNLINNLNCTANGPVTGIVLSGGTTTNVTNNTINTLYNNSGSGTISGITYSSGTTVNISKNKIYDLSGSSSGTLIAGISYSNSATTANISNNLIGDLRATAASSTTAIVGIDMTTAGANSALNVYYNTIYINASSSGANFGTAGIYHAAVATATTAALDLRNNIVVNTSTPAGTGLAIAYRKSNTSLVNYASTSNNNLLYAGTGSNRYLYYADGSNNDPAGSLATYKTRMSPRDAGSVTENPTWVTTTGSSANFLHINTTTATQIEGGAAAISGYADDFDGNTRSATTPDIGADEFAGVAQDLTGPVISYTALAATCVTGNRTLTATITDASGVPTSGAGLPVLYWRINAGAYSAATGSFVSGNTYSFSFGAGAAFGETVSYYIVAQDVVTTPNVNASPTGASGFTANPPAASTAPTTPSSYTLIAPMGGVYTVGTAGGSSFSSLTAAVAAYNSALCFTGDVTFSLTNATATPYNTTNGETFPITINSNANSGSYTLTIKPATGVSPVITAANITATLSLSGAKNVIIDGSNTSGGTSKDLTITNTNTVGVTVLLINGAQNNIVKNNVLQGVSTSGLGSVVAISTSSTVGNSNNTIQNNDITRGATSPSIGVGNLGSLGFPNANNVITGNRIFDWSTAGISDLGYSNATVYSNNEIYEVATQTTALAGFFPQATNINGFTFSGNYIHDLKSSNAGLIYGIYLYDISTTAVGTIVNNMIDLNTAASTQLLGIYDNTATGEQFDIYFNTIRISGTATGSSGSAAYWRNQTSTANLRNNILINTRTGGTGTGTTKHYAIKQTVATTALTSDYNNIYNSTGTNNVFGYSPSADRADIAAWRTANSGKDVNSQSQAVTFTSSQLHVDNANGTNINFINQKGVAISTVSTDYDGDTRCTASCTGSAVPDIGADEFTPAGCASPAFGTVTTTATTASVPFTCSGCTPALSYIVEYGAVGYTPSAAGTYTSGVTTSTSPASLPASGSLSPNTSYDVYIRQDCSSNATGYSSNTKTTITTIPNCATPTSPANAATGVCFNNTPFAWSVPVGGAAGYKFYLGTDGAGTSTPTNGINGTNVGNVLTATVTALVPNTTYYWQVKPTNAGGDATGCPIYSFTTATSAETTPVTANFEACFDWIVVNDATNKWVQGTATNNGGSKGVYISNDNGVSNAYSIGTAQVSHFYKDITIPAGQTVINLSFDWKGQGESVSADRLRVYDAPTTVTPVAGTDLGTTNQVGAANYNLSSTYATVNIPLSASDAGTTRRIIFSWKNDNSLGSQPPAAIDNISITSSAPAAPLCANYTTPANAATGICSPGSLNWTAPGSGSAPTGYKLYFGTDGAGVTNPTTVVNGTNLGNVLTYGFSGLSAGTTYYWKVVPTNVTGDATGCAIQSFTTSGSVAETTTPISDDFENCPEWTIVNAATNKWISGSATNNGGSKSMYISNDNGTTNAYSNTSQTSHFYRDVTFPAGQTIYNFSFDLKGLQETFSGTVYDHLMVYIAPTSVTPVAGTPASSSTTLSGATLLYNQTIDFTGWTNVIVPLTSTQVGNASANSTMRIIFTWQNDGTTSVTPPAAVDNISITSAAPVPMVISSITGTQQTGPIVQGSSNNNMLRINVDVTGSTGGISLTALTVSGANNTSNADFGTIKLFTGTSSAPTGGALATTTLASPTFSSFSSALATGTNYFWVTYDVVSGATPGNVGDVIIPSGGMTFTATSPAVTPTGQPTLAINPAGNRPILGAMCGSNYTINNTIATGVNGANYNYNSFTEAINDLNLLGLSCSVVFNVKDGQTFNEKTPAITTSGTSTKTITFQRDNSTGVKPTLVGTTGVSTINDAVVQLNGVDYLRWDGINIADNASNTNNTTRFEYGVFLNGLAGNGCKNNIFKNSNVSLTTANTSTRGIYTYGAGGTGGDNSNNQFLNLQVSNVVDGYDFSGYGSPDDNNNEINTEAGGTSSITNIGSSSNSGNYGVVISYQTNFKLKNTTISNIVGSSSSDNYGFYGSFGTLNTMEITGNTIQNINPGTVWEVIGINIIDGSAATISKNTIKNITAGAYVEGIHITGTSLVATIDSNIIGGPGATLTSTKTSTEVHGINCYLAGADGQLIRGNVISNLEATAAGVTSVYGISIGTEDCEVIGNTLQNFNSNGTGTAVYQIAISGEAGSNYALIKNNTISNFSVTGVSDVWAIYAEGYNSVVEGNTITAIKATSSNSSGIATGGDDCEVRSNTIRGITSAANNKLAGALGLYGAGINMVEKNVIDSVVSTGTTGAIALGITVDGSFGGTFNITNNMVSKIIANGSNITTGGVRGISSENGATSRVYNNTVYLEGTSTNAAHTSGALFLSGNGSLDYRNNILVNNYNPTTGTAASCVYSTRSAANTLSQIATTSNNNILSNGGFGKSYLLTTNAGSQSTLTNYQSTLTSPRETASLFVTSVPFVQVSSFPSNLHIDLTSPTLCNINNKGVAITTPIAVPDDIDAAGVRGTTPDAGADEWTMPIPAAGTAAASVNPACPSVNNVISISSAGAASGSEFSYQWQVDNGGGYANVTNTGIYTGATTTTLTLTGYTTAINGYKYRLNVNRCSPTVATGSSNEVTLVVTCDYTWTGASTVDNNWTTATNWNIGVPVNSCATNVVIPSGTPRNPVLTGAVSVGDITLGDNKTLDLGSNNITACGNWTGGSTTASSVIGAGKVILTGATAQTLSGRTAFTTLHLAKTTGTTATMQSGSAFDINTAVELESGTLATGGGTLTFKSTSTTQIAVLDNFTTGYTGNLTGNITAERYYSTTGVTNQHYMGSPVATTLAQFGAGSSSGFVTPKPTCDETALASTSVYGSVFSYDQSNGSSCSLAGWKVEAGSTAATAAKGFSVTKTGSNVLSVSGTPNTAASYGQSGTNAGWSNSSLQGRPMTAGWVLVSNPYLAYLDFTTQGAPTNFTSEVKVWRTTGAFAGSYQDLQPGEMIAPFQGFFVHSTATGSYPINGNKRTRSTAGTFQAQANDQQLSILATNNNTTLADITMVAFNSDATTGFDNDYDAQKIAGTLGRHTLYTLGANNLWMSKNIHKSIAETSTITMGFEPEVAGTYTFSFDGLNSFDPTSYIMLEDRKLGTMYNVRNGDYQFTADSADQWERFVLHFTPAAEVTATDENCNSLGNINVTQPGTANWTYTLTDANNATVATGTLNETTQISTAVATGTYTLTLVDNNNYTVAKTVTVNGAGAVAAVFTPSVNATQTNMPVNFTSSSVATSYYWDFGDGTTESGQNVIHSYADTGTYTVTLIVISEGGCSTSSSQTVTVSQTATGIGTIANGGPISIWSNGGRVYVDFSKQSKVEAEIQIYNVIGQELVNEKFGRSTIYSKPIANIEVGYVIVKVKNAGSFTTKKVLITNN